MIRILRGRVVLAASLLVVVLVGGCVTKEAEQDIAWRESVSPRLVAPEVLRAVGLEVVWENKLPIKEKESLDRFFILDNRIYALSDRNYMFSLDRETGKLVFGSFFAPEGFPLYRPKVYNDQLLSTVGNRLVEIDPVSGEQRWMKELDFGVTCPAVRNSSYYYLAGADKRLHALRVADKVEVFKIAADDDSMITSIVVNEDFVVFCTDSGFCAGMGPDRPKQLWKFNAADGIVGPVVRDGQLIFFSSKDTNLYCINALTGEFLWKYPSGAALEKSPVVTGDVVYQYAQYKGLAAIDKRNGKAIWQLAQGVGLLAQDGRKAYVITKTGGLVVMDNDKAKQLLAINFAKVSKYTANVIDSKIYIGDEAGRILCLKPIE